jgi:small subunit ribosomal protein S2
MAEPKVPSMQDLLTAGAHFGHKVSRAHPKMRDYIFGARDGISIIDLEKTEEKLKEAVKGAYELGKAGKVMLVVATKKQSKEIAKDLAKEADTPFMTERWIGGLLTNFEEMKRKIRKLTELKDEKEKGKLDHYTKKEQLLLDRELNKFEREYGGIVNMATIPDAMFLADAVSDNIAVKEGLRLNIKLLGFSDTNADPNWFDFPVPANDDGIKSIKLICEAVIRAYAQGKKEAGHNTNPAKPEVVEESEEEVKTEKKSKKADKEETEEVVAEVDPELVEETLAIEEEVEKAEVADAERKV